MMTFFEELSDLQSKLSRGQIEIDAPCGGEPLNEILGGISARAQINISHPGKFPDTEKELKLATSLIKMLQKKNNS